MGLISRFSERRERKVQENIKKTLVARLTELGVQVLNAPPREPYKFQTGIFHADVVSSGMTREGAENNFLKVAQYRKVKSLYDLEYEYSSRRTAILARVYQYQ